ncbi:Larval/pupal cuticle protein H1C, partial [Pseudolycoriella hygida]
MAFKILCTLAALSVAASNAGFIDSAYTRDVHSHHDEYAPVAKYAYSAPSVNHVYNTVKEIATHAPVQQYTAAPIHEVQYAPVQKTVEYTPVVHKNVHYDHHSTPSHTLAYPVKKIQAYAPIAKTISYAPAAVIEPVHHHEPTYQHTHESVERNHAGTVSHYGKTVSTPHSHVQKLDTRVTNEHYKVAAVPTVHYKVAPVVHHEAPEVHHYTHSTPVALEYSQPAPVQHHYTAPVQHQYSHSAPVQHHYSHSTPVQHHSHSAPIQHYTQSAPTQQYAHAAPVVAYNKAVKYSSADAVSHASFHSNDAQYS